MIPFVVQDPHHSPVGSSLGASVVVVTRMLQSGGEIGPWLQRLLASVLGLVGLMATVVMVYFVALICDKSVKWCSPSPIPTNENNDENNGRQRLDRERLELDDKKRIVKQLFANETFLYTGGTAGTEASTSKNTDFDGENDTIEHGIQLQELSTQGTSESENAPMVQEVTANSNPAQTTIDSKEDSEVKQEGTLDMFSTNEPGCCICLAPYREGDLVLRSKHCSHMFHASCCEDWILHKPTCPLCSKPMILDAEWEATAVSVLGQELYNALLSAQREATDDPPVSSV